MRTVAADEWETANSALTPMAMIRAQGLADWRRLFVGGMDFMRRVWSVLEIDYWAIRRGVNSTPLKRATGIKETHWHHLRAEWQCFNVSGAQNALRSRRLPAIQASGLLRSFRGDRHRQNMGFRRMRNPCEGAGIAADYLTEVHRDSARQTFAKQPSHQIPERNNCLESAHSSGRFSA
jgi:hypothetical protein